MAKLILIFALALIAVVNAAPGVEVNEGEEIVVPVRMVPQPEARITCDLLSIFPVNDSACAAHCRLRGFAGGWCERGVCHCRW